MAQLAWMQLEGVMLRIPLEPNRRTGGSEEDDVRSTFLLAVDDAPTGLSVSLPTRDPRHVVLSGTTVT